MRPPAADIVVVASQGPDSGDERRITTLLADVPHRVWAFERGSRAKAAFALLRRLRVDRPRLLVIEGTGLGVCVPAMLAARLGWTRYVVSSGDAVGPFYALHGPAAGVFGAIYERLLCRGSAGFIGWTPYLAGRAMTFGSPCAMTAANWSDLAFSEDLRTAGRARWAHGDDEVVFGIVGSLTWSERHAYCYGKELVEALRLTTNPKVRVLVVGDGDGGRHLEALAGEDPRITFTGRLTGDDLGEAYAAIDYLSLPQSRDGVGLFRYTTKLSEYAASGARIVTGHLPFAYDIDDLPISRVQGDAPWDPRYLRELAALMDRAQPPAPGRTAHDLAVFDRRSQQRRVAAFLADLLDGS